MIVSFFFYLRPWGPKKESNILHKMFGKWAERKLQKSSWWQSKNTLVKCARISVVYWFSLIGCQERKCYIFWFSCLDDSVVTQNTNYFNYIMTIRDSVYPFYLWWQWPGHTGQGQPWETQPHWSVQLGSQMFGEMSLCCPSLN